MKVQIILLPKPLVLGKSLKWIFLLFVEMGVVFPAYHRFI